MNAQEPPFPSSVTAVPDLGLCASISAKSVGRSCARVKFKVHPFAVFIGSLGNAACPRFGECVENRFAGTYTISVRIHSTNNELKMRLLELMNFLICRPAAGLTGLARWGGVAAEDTVCVVNHTK